MTEHALKSIAIVTGASSGLGFEIASGLIKNGINTCLVARDAARLSTAVSRINRPPETTVFHYAANVGIEAEVEGLFSHIKKEGFIPKFLINAAGVGRFCEPGEIDRKLIDIVFEANLIGVILMSSFALKEMKTSGGVIINIMSTAALLGREKESVYCAAKWGARGFTEAIKAATKGTPVSVIGIFPGGMNTPFWTPDCGLAPNTSKFMNPKDVSNRILTQILEQDTTVATDLTINRRS
jgi:short-subunit dehydrogenase